MLRATVMEGVVAKEWERVLTETEPDLDWDYTTAVEI